jgi:hypothetical protein
MATAGRVPLAMIALAEVARNYKGQVNSSEIFNLLLGNNSNG